MQKIRNKGILIIILFIVSGYAQADIAVNATHSIVSTMETADGYNTTIEVTLTNASTSSLSDVVLIPQESVFASPLQENNNLSFTSIDSGGTATVIWTVNTMEPHQNFSMKPIKLQGNALDQNGVMVFFLVVSEGGIQ